MDLEKLRKNLNARRIDFYLAESREDAVDHILRQVKDTSVGFGGSKTVETLGLYEALAENNQVHWHWKDGALEEVYRAAAEAPVYVSGVNAVSETGELVNVDGRGNRVAAQSYAVGKRVFLFAGSNKVCPDLTAAMERARTVAAPINLQRFAGKRPCTGTQQCFDCRSPDRGCCIMEIMMFKPMGCDKVELILLDESLGY